ncbi:winged helix-turn-helix transcriptional regulator [Streptomyces sioyaensis]|uniref:winged helix-turn-helix transcriptional regulator n=1 Tax=Streptomyces sioyaensis TaxID=67364 RepID=UPI0037A22288
MTPPPPRIAGADEAAGPESTPPVGCGPPAHRTPPHQGRRTATPLAARPTPVPLTADADLIAAFEVLGRKWTGIILHALATRPARYGELGTAIERISTKMLADRLRELVEAGPVTHDHPLPPGPATYTLTDDGRALLPALEQIRSWSQHRTTSSR